jgi:hypothetical protein
MLLLQTEARAQNNQTKGLFDLYKFQKELEAIQGNTIELPCCAILNPTQLRASLICRIAKPREMKI